jgi:hypothetical protein
MAATRRRTKIVDGVEQAHGGPASIGAHVRPANIRRGHGYGMGVAVILEPELAGSLCCRSGIGTVGWPGAYGGWWQAGPTDQSVLIVLT